MMSDLENQIPLIYFRPFFLTQENGRTHYYVT